MLKYEFKKAGIVHVISANFSANRKLGQDRLILQTYHFSEDQVKFNDLKQDNKNCLNCRFSYNSGNGKCYTHLGLMGLGVRTMLKRLHKKQVPEFNEEQWQSFIKKLRLLNIELIRFGAYGEPVLLGEQLIIDLLKTNHQKYTGYTQTWNNPVYGFGRKYFKGSVHSLQELAEAHLRGYSCYLAAKKPEKIGVICPNDLAKVNCVDCGLCNAAYTPDIIGKLKHH